MVDTNSGDQTFLDQFERNAMNVGEYVRIFDPDGGQVVDVEKAAVVDFVGQPPAKNSGDRPDRREAVRD